MIEFARHVAGMDGAHSTEFSDGGDFPVVALVTEWTEGDGQVMERGDNDDLGGHHAPRGARSEPDAKFIVRANLRSGNGLGAASTSIRSE